MFKVRPNLLWGSKAQNCSIRGDESELMLGMQQNLRKNAEENSPKHQLSEAIDLLDRASRLFEEAGNPEISDAILNILNDAVVEANVLPYLKEEESDLLNAEDPRKIFDFNLCPMCQGERDGRDHLDPAKKDPKSPTYCDYEECGHCGFDHSYEPEQAIKWHRKNDSNNDLYKAKDKGPKINLHEAKKWMARNKNRDDFRDPMTGELNHTRLAEECANELNFYSDKVNWTIPDEIFDLAINFD